METTPTPPIRFRIRRKYWSVIPAMGARISGGSTATFPMRNTTDLSGNGRPREGGRRAINIP